MAVRGGTLMGWRMHKRAETKPDGRKIYYYSFEWVSEMASAYRNLSELIHAFGARPATTQSESRLRAYLHRRLRERGLKVFEQPFRSVASLTPAWLTVSALFLLSAGLAWVNAPLAWLAGAICSLAAMGMFWGLVSGRWDVMRLFPQRASANLIVVVPAQGQPRRRVVLMAHLDSQRAALMWHPKHVRSFGRNFQLQARLLMAHTLLAVLLACAPLIGQAWVVALARAVMTLGGLLALYGAAILLHRERFLPWVQGANDNGSGTAVLLTTLERLAEQPLPHTEVWGVFTGCEEVGRPNGAFAFEREYGYALRDAEFVIIDHIGLGEPRYLVAEAMLPRARAHPDMVRKFECLAQEHPEWNLKPSAVPHGAYTDALPFHLGGYKAIALWCEQEPGVPPNWHWITDTLENIAERDLERAVQVVEAFLR
ncbi:MAG: M28 family peptidase [Fimbriimonadales bacterium]|nr:M28 family peptidase [Fimbriimonadales bacterium]